MEAHKEAIDRVVDQALARAGVTAADLDAVAVTVGPGLSLCLKVRSVVSVKELALRKERAVSMSCPHVPQGEVLSACRSLCC